MLIKCQDYYLAHPDAQPPTGHNFTLTNGTLETYEDIAEVAFGKKGRELISLILYTELLGTCALFLILQKGTLLQGTLCASVAQVTVELIVHAIWYRACLLMLAQAFLT